jgi:D-beta-D-heptose 7-phosphate kinase/D-beta-D-heptose 1-phosphate adenosyltransferase
MRLVSCNGCFNGLHYGHLFYLGFALGHGDALVVGINDDSHIRQKKGYVPVPEAERVKALMDLGFIREVIVFHEPDPREFIKKVRPNIHCTGAEYQNGTCIEESLCRELGIELVYVPRIGRWSTRTLLSGEITSEGNLKSKSAAKA